MLKRVGLALVLVLVWLASNQSASGQEITYRPNQTATIDIAFEGKDAGQITNVKIMFSLADALSPKQPGFSTSMIGLVQGTGNVFHVPIQIKDNQATGTYRIQLVNATINPTAPVILVYQPGEFPDVTIKVENPRTLEKPKIKSITPH